VANSPLHKAPLGLLELLALKTLGQQPSAFGDTVQPSLDVLELYAATTQTNTAETAGPQAFPFAIVNTPTPGPQRLRGLSGVVDVGANAGTQLRMYLGIRQSSATANLLSILAENVIYTPVVGARYVVTTGLCDIMLPPGWQLVFEAASNASGADHVASMRRILQVLPNF